MFLILYLPLLGLSRSFEDIYSSLKLRYSILYVSEDKSEWNAIQQQVENITKNSEAYCHEKFDKSTYGLCKDMIDAFQTLHFSKGEHVNKELSNIPRNSEVVYLFNMDDDINIDFNYLINKKKVVIDDLYLLEDGDDKQYKSRILKQNQVLNFLKVDIFNKKRNKNDNMLRINIKGNIKYKVSYLVISHYDVNFHYFDLEVDTLVLFNSKINGETIRATNLLVNSISHKHIIENVDSLLGAKLIQVHQYGIFYNDDGDNPEKVQKEDDDEIDDLVKMDYQIVYQKDRWSLYSKSHDQDVDYASEDYFYVPYQFSDIFNLIVHSLNFDLNVNDSSIEKVKDINITVMNLVDYVTPVHIFLKSTESINITTSGFVKDLKEKPKVIVHSDPNSKIEHDDLIEVDNRPFYSYSPKPLIPDPTSPPVPPALPKYQKYSMIYVTSNYTYCKEFKQSMNEIYRNYTNLCHDEDVVSNFDDYNDCCLFYSNAGEYLCSNGYDINSKLKKISPYTDTLVILDNVKDMYVNFENLNGQMNVVVAGFEPEEEDENKVFKKVMNSIKKKPTKKVKDDDDDDDMNLNAIYIQGNISEKVSSLELMLLNVSVTGHELNVDSLVLYECGFGANTEPIRTNYLTVSIRTHYHIIMKQHRLDLIKVNQYGIEFFDESLNNDPSHFDFVPFDMRVSFQNDRWVLLTRDHYNKSEEYYQVPYGYLPYSYANKLNIILSALNFDFHIENSIIEKVQPVNLTIQNFVPIKDTEKIFLSSDDNDDEVPNLILTTSGAWDHLEKPPEITVGLSNMIELITPKNLTVSKEDLYSYTPKIQPENPFNPFIYPVMSYLCVSSKKSKCTEKQTDFEKEKEEYKENCKSDLYYDSYDGGYEECLAYYESLGNYYVSDGSDLNQVISSISNATDNLLIACDISDLTFDFNKLADQMSIVLVNTKDDDGHFKKLNMMRPKINAKSSDLKVNIVGGINSKVSYLSILYFDVNFVENDLNVDSLLLASCSFVESTQKIRTNNFIVDETSQDNIMKNIDKINQKDLIQVKQYGFVPSDYSNDYRYSYNEHDFIDKDFRISFANDRWLLLAKDHKSANDGDDYVPYSNNGKEFGFIPYSYCESFNLIAKAFDFDFYVEGSVITSTKPVNVSVLNLAIVEASSKLFNHRDVKITSSGNWVAVKNKTKVILTVDDDEVSLKNVAADVDVVKENVYVYVPKSHQEHDGGGDESSSDFEPTYESSSSDDDGSGTDDDKDKKKKDKMKLIFIIGCSVGGVMIIVLIVVLVWYFVSHKKKNFRSSTINSTNQLNQLLLNN